MEVKVSKKGEDYAEIVVEGEEHTLGNLIANYLLRTKGVKFASYSMPHPLERKIVIRVMTDGSITPLDAFKAAVEKIKADLEKFEGEIEAI